ncbi:calcium/calmodulin-dependent protein kinase [Apiospora kogelbergensis]|uniref:calcium/calmodulin-dependent protein kinase n=1 Tax=Apiospora kogelbergensis TaxID=1337665 RepID=UPI00312D5BC0
MSRPYAIFSLQPLNEGAKEVVNDHNNHKLVCKIQNENVLDVGHVQPISNNNTLATLGRNGDIIVEGNSISKIQCSFEINPDTNDVMFYDRSSNQQCQVAGLNATPFQSDRERKVVVQQNVNTIIGMGGRNSSLVQFTLVWHKTTYVETKEQIEKRKTAELEENPRLARTIDTTADTVPPSRYETRIHTPARVRQKLIPHVIESIGSGAHGRVEKAFDLRGKQFFAMKTLHQPPAEEKSEREAFQYYYLKREVEALSRCEHPHIIKFLDLLVEKNDEKNVEDSPKICMELMDGTLTSLLKGGPDRKVAETVYHHMLQALDFLATKSIVHLDVKPDNIFYTRTPGHYHFRLGDLGLSGGTPLYMAPELFLDMPQTHKSDVWSLYVTMLWTADFCDFRESSMEFRNQSEVLDEVLRLASEPGPDRIAEMGRKDPEKRASAAQMLVKHFYGDGLTTHKKKVPPSKM